MVLTSVQKSHPIHKYEQLEKGTQSFIYNDLVYAQNISHFSKEQVYVELFIVAYLNQRPMCHNAHLNVQL